MEQTYEPHLVTRSLKVTEMICPECDDIIMDALSVLDGVENVSTDWRLNSVTLTYDLHRIHLEEVESVLTEIGFPPDPHFFERHKREWFHFTEQNERENLEAIPRDLTQPFFPD